MTNEGVFILICSFWGGIFMGVFKMFFFIVINPTHILLALISMQMFKQIINDIKLTLLEGHKVCLFLNKMLEDNSYSVL